MVGDGAAAHVDPASGGRSGKAPGRPLVVEFVGCTGSGKTTICGKAIRLIEAAGLEPVAVHADHFFASAGGRRLRSRHLQNLVMEAAALPYIVRRPRSYLRLLRFGGRALQHYSVPLPRSLNQLRGVVRKIGGYEAARAVASRRHGGAAILDEGLVHAAHNLLAHSETPPLESDIIEFATLIPLPDLIVHVRAPLEVLEERARSRLDFRRRLRGRPAIEAFLSHGLRVFDRLTELPEIRTRVMTLDNDAASLALTGELATLVTGRVVEMLRNA